MKPSDILAQQNIEYEESLRQDQLKEEEERRLQNIVRKEEEQRVHTLQENSSDEHESEYVLSQAQLRAKRLLYFDNITHNKKYTRKQRCTYLTTANTRCKLFCKQGSYCHIHNKRKNSSLHDTVK